MTPVGPLVAAALVAGGDAAVRRCGRPCCAAGATSDFSGSVRVTSAKSEHARAAPARRGRLVLTDSPCLFAPCESGRLGTGPPKMSIRSPSARLTIARLVSGALAAAVPGALALALAVEGVDAGHLDPETFSTAILIWVLLASGRDDEGVLALVEQPVALLRDDRPQQDVPAGWLILLTCCASLPLRACDTNAVERCLGEDHVVADQHVVGVELVRGEHVHARRRCAGDFQVSSSSRSRDHEHRARAVGDACASTADRVLGRAARRRRRSR